LFYHLGVLASADRLTLAPELHGELVSQRRSGATAFYHGDALGSVRALTNSAQTVTDTRDYQAFGLTNASSGSTANRFWWVGRLGYYSQPDTGDYWVRARVYRPTIGRWVSRDPLWAQTVSAYHYADANPVGAVDPSGEIAPAAILAIGVCAFMLFEVHHVYEASKLHTDDLAKCCRSPRTCHRGPWIITVTQSNGKKSRSFQCWHPDMPCDTEKYPVRVRYKEGKGWGDWTEAKLRGDWQCTA
jgi:RHS repeat-associated protein